MIYVEVGYVHKSNGGTVEHNYVYSSDWKDQLISYDGKAITYDNIGNPLNYMGRTMTWDYGRRLMSITDGGNQAKYSWAFLGLCWAWYASFCGWATSYWRCYSGNRSNCVITI